MKTTLNSPVKVYFAEEDYKLLKDLAENEGLELAAFIRQKMLSLVKQKNKKSFSISINKKDNDYKSKFDTLIIKLGFCEVQLYNTPSKEAKDLILKNIKTFIDQLLDLLNEKKQQEYKDLLYNMINDKIKIREVS